MKINTDMIFAYILILTKIKTNIIEPNIKEKKDMKLKELVINCIKLKNFLIPKDEQENKQLYYYIQYIDLFESNGLSHLYLMEEKSFIWKF